MLFQPISWIVDYLNGLKIRRITRFLNYVGARCVFQKGLQIKGGQYISIGNDCYFGKECRIEAWDKYNDEKYSPKIIIGNRVRINSTCHIGAINKVQIGDDCLFGSHVMIIDHSHGNNNPLEMVLHPSERNLFSKGPVIIGEKCWIAENVVILPDVRIGNCSVIGASAVVTKDVPDYSVVAGNPAKIVKRILE